MTITATKLRANIYNIMDNIIKTGQPVEIDRAGKKLRISLVSKNTTQGSKLNKLIPRPEAITSSPEDFTHIDWSHEWNP